MAMVARLMDATKLPYDITRIVFSPDGSAIIAGEDDCGLVLVCN